MTHDELIEKVATVLNEQEGCYFQPQDYHRGAAKEVIATILAALQEPTEGMLLAAKGFGDTQAWQEMLAASALGEQSDG